MQVCSAVQWLLRNGPVIRHRLLVYRRRCRRTLQWVTRLCADNNNEEVDITHAGTLHRLYVFIITFFVMLIWVRLSLSSAWDTIRQKSLTWTQLNLGHLAKKIYKKKRLKQINASARLIQYRFRSVKAGRRRRLIRANSSLSKWVMRGTVSTIYQSLAKIIQFTAAWLVW